MEPKKELPPQADDPARVGDEVLEGLRRLAFSQNADPVRLAACDPDEPGEFLRLAESLDLFGVSELKIPKPGSLELRFYDRFRAMELLLQIAREKDSRDGSALLADALGDAARLIAERKPEENAVPDE